MSLNGLDDPRIVEAHEAGVAEPGGWFLLKYSSRDEVELLDKGNGGVAEIRNSIASFEEESPLYGFLRYRRRNVIVKYLPEDCSRLIQARVAVHFNAVCERFSPYDAIFEVSTAAELRDTKLSAACSLHAASGSTASSTSSRRRRLMEIAEEDEEEQRSPKRQSLVPETDGDRPRTPGAASTAAGEVRLNSELASSPEHSKFSASTTSEVPRFMGLPDAPASPTRSIDTTDSRTDAYSYYSASKPKVKLGPRPKADAAAVPQTAGNFRPVSSLPAGYKLFGKGQKKSKGKDGDAASLLHEEIPEAEPPADADAAASPTITSQDLFGIGGDASRPSTPASTLSVPAAPAKPTITPEKARLMKAMKLREKKKKQQQQQQQQKQKQKPAEAAAAAAAASGVDASGAEDDKNAITGEEIGQGNELEHSAAIESHDDDDDDDDDDDGKEGDDGRREAGEANARVNEEKQQKSEGAEGRKASISQADSGVVLDSLSSSVQIDEVSEGARSESRTQSPTVASSEHDGSTAASSRSDATDETVRAKNADEQQVTGQAKADDVTSAFVDMQDKGDAPADDAGPIASGRQQRPRGEGRAAEVVDASSRAAVVVVGAAADASSSSPEENESAAAAQTKETGGSIALERAEGAAAAEAAAGAANKGSANTENEKGRKGIAGPISNFSANIPTCDAPPAASLGGMGSGAAEIPLAAPGDVAQATDKGELGSSPLPRTLGPKLSTQDLVDAATAAAQTTVATPSMELQMDPLPAAQEAAPAALEKASDAAAAAAAAAAAPDDEPRQRPRRSAASIPPPIRTDLTEPEEAGSDGDGDGDGDGDAVAQEIHQGDDDATAQDGNKPMAATKSPLTPVFPGAAIANGPLGARAPPAHTVRTVSNPVRGNFIAPTDVTQSTARSLSSGAALLHKVTQQQSASLATMKPNVGSSISQRIKALEKFSATSGDQTRPVSRERPSSTFFAVQKRDTSRPPSVVDRTKSLKGRAASPTPSQDEFPPLEAGRVRLQRSGSVVSRVSMFEPLAASASNASGLAPGAQSRGRPESVAVTARAAQDLSQLSGHELPKDASDYSYLDLKQPPPPAADHHQRGGEGSERRSRSLERDGEDDMGRRSSLNTVKGFFKDPRKSVTVSTNVRHAIVSRTTTQSPSSAGRRSITIDRDYLANSSVTEDSFSGDERSDKKTSRAGRFMRKLSNFSSGSKGKAAPSAEESSAAAAAAAQNAGLDGQPSMAPAGSADASIVSDLGDVNVQFPDSLLWKRRNLCLDSQGFLILGALPAQGSRTAQGTKRYHMGEFRQPYAPDVEVQELPNSVVLDFVEGTGIQLACEDRTGQLNVLHVLQAAHANHAR
ncbi:hypothetical protein Trco_008381 [Trichoderma cornu-damae]|uniref:ADF-H domain-containing protein n=1 Tax=Trichoderma cornu-damae TaxID=654480 RepID=A0A9P8TRE2_9HYPO|nr:hypothetical protein Trco_008381 [Trichoderma cornu-damae]